MLVVTLAQPEPEPALELDACKQCTLVWFDWPTYGQVPEGAPETTNTMPLLTTEILVANRLKEFNEREQTARKKEKKKTVRDSLRTLLEGGGTGSGAVLAECRELREQRDSFILRPNEIPPFWKD